MKIALLVYVFTILFIATLECPTVKKKSILPSQSLECSAYSRPAHLPFLAVLTDPHIPSGVV